MTVSRFGGVALIAGVGVLCTELGRCIRRDVRQRNARIWYRARSRRFFEHRNGVNMWSTLLALLWCLCVAVVLFRDSTGATPSNL